MEGVKLSKPAKVYPLSLTKRNSLDTWINEKLRKYYIYPSTMLGNHSEAITLQASE